jgi:asparagine synthase (glutamine-hydrolysing)
MCGLTGFWQFQESPEQFLKETVSSMAKIILSRGPDSYGNWVCSQNGLALGHNRLSIRDLSSAGAQPMVSQSGRFIIAYNGEIYNTDELKNLVKDISFHGHSDTEVLLECCAAIGVLNTLKKANGMFAFALWDRQERCLFLARDRLGIKPLYWGFQNGNLLFGSQVGAFTRFPSWQCEIDKQALASYFTHNYIRGPLSIYKGIQQVEPGHIICIKADKQIYNEAFWSLNEVLNKTKIDSRPMAFLEDELDELLRDAVKSRMVADVPLGAFLSGGIDSSTVVAMMQAQSTRRINTFSIGFNEAEFNEAHHAKEVANLLGTDHHEHYFDEKDAINLIPNLSEWFDEPFADSSQLPTYLVSLIARQQVTVSLSGDGGDELFAGYNRYVLAQKLWKKIGFVPLAVRKTLAHIINSFSPKQIDFLSKVIPASKRPQQLADKLYKLASVIKADRQLFYKNLVSLWPGDIQLVKETYDNFMFPAADVDLDYISEMQFIDTLTYLPNDILTKVDRASMAVSLEARVPFLDYRVVEFAWRLPLSYKLNQNNSKLILRNVLNRYVPEHVFNRPKMGFGVPIGDWLRGPLQEWANDLLSEKKLKNMGLLNESPILTRWREHQSGKYNWQYSLWGVLMFMVWYEKWVKN